MGENSKISWTDHTANFWWGCFKVSDGCKNCYAETWANRWGKSIWGPPTNTRREYKRAAWRDVSKWDKQAADQGIRYRVFVQSMSDFFEDHPQVVDWRNDALDLMAKCANLDFQILTKRPENVLKMIPAYWRKGMPKHFQVGTSVENQEQADRRIPHLMEVPAAIRFLSCEPLLSPIDVGLGWQYVNWVITGAESGPGARPMQLDWVRSLRDQCKVADVPFFFKQMVINGKKIELPELDGKVWAEMPK